MIPCPVLIYIAEQTVIAYPIAAHIIHERLVWFGKLVDSPVIAVKSFSASVALGRGDYRDCLVDIVWPLITSRAVVKRFCTRAVFALSRRMSVSDCPSQSVVRYRRID